MPKRKQVPGHMSRDLSIEAIVIPDYSTMSVAFIPEAKWPGSVQMMSN